MWRTRESKMENVPNSLPCTHQALSPRHFTKTGEQSQRRELDFQLKRASSHMYRALGPLEGQSSTGAFSHFFKQGASVRVLEPPFSLLSIVKHCYTQKVWLPASERGRLGTGDTHVREVALQKQ